MKDRKEELLMNIEALVNILTQECEHEVMMETYERKVKAIVEYYFAKRF